MSYKQRFAFLCVLRICGDCDEDMFCQLCVERLHRTGNSTDHLRVSIDMCDECQFQVKFAEDDT